MIAGTMSQYGQNHGKQRAVVIFGGTSSLFTAEPGFHLQPICTNDAMQEAGSDVMKHKRWVLFKESLVFAESIERLLSQQGAVVWLMSGIEKYADCSECMEKEFSAMQRVYGKGVLPSGRAFVMTIANNYLNSHHDILGLFVSGKTVKGIFPCFNKKTRADRTRFNGHVLKSFYCV